MLTYLLIWVNLFPFIWQAKLLQDNGNRGRCVHTPKTSKPFSVREVSILTAACWEPSWLVKAISDTLHIASLIFTAVLFYYLIDSVHCRMQHGVWLVFYTPTEVFKHIFIHHAVAVFVYVVIVSVDLTAWVIVGGVSHSLRDEGHL